MQCPLCSTLLKQHLLQPTLSIISCPSESCIYPFNLSVAELHEKNLIHEVTTTDIMTSMKTKMVEDANVDSRIAEFITRGDHDIA